jgi:hypothetical protein
VESGEWDPTPGSRSEKQRETAGVFFATQEPPRPVHQIDQAHVQFPASVVSPVDRLQKRIGAPALPQACTAHPKCTVCPFWGKDILSIFDEKDPNSARLTARENAPELCLEHLAEWVSSHSEGLTSLHVGIPQVCLHHRSPFDLMTTLLRL